MALVRWAPLTEIDTLHHEMSRLFDSLTLPHRSIDRVAFIPAAEVEDMADAIRLKLELPGLEAKDLDIQVSAKAVTISGERKSQTDSEENGMKRSEFRYGRFQRVVPLHTRVVSDKTQAEYKDGILTLTLTKAEEEKNKTFKVELG